MSTETFIKYDQIIFTCIWTSWDKSALLFVQIVNICLVVFLLKPQQMHEHADNPLLDYIRTVALTSFPGKGKLMKQQRWLYFKNKWNLLELSIILLSWSAVAAFIQRTLITNRDIAYYQNHNDK